MHMFASRKLLKLSTSKIADRRVATYSFIGVHETESNAYRAHEEPHFLLNKLETHRQQRKSNEKVQSTEDEFLLGRPRVDTRTRHIVAETDRRQRDETEIESDEKVPVVFVAIPDVSCQQQQTQRHSKQITNNSVLLYVYTVCVN